MYRKGKWPLLYDDKIKLYLLDTKFISCIKFINVFFFCLLTKPSNYELLKTICQIYNLRKYILVKFFN